MTSRDSEENRRDSLDLAREDPRRLQRLIARPRPEHQSTLHRWMEEEDRRLLVMPARANWKALKTAYESQPQSYEELISLRGVGPSTVRGLTLVAELIYGEKPCWQVPVRFSFTVGGKDSAPFPVDRCSMDQAVDILKTGIYATSVRREEKGRALRRLRRCIPTSRSPLKPTPDEGRVPLHFNGDLN